MSGGPSADRFADCVVRRTSWDVMMKPGIVLATMIIPVMMASLIILYVLNTHAGHIAFTSDSVSLGIMAGAIVECSIIGFLLYKTTSRSIRHLDRDEIWVRSLTDYVESKGLDVSDLTAEADKLTHRKISLSRGVSLIIWAFTILLMFGIVAYLVVEGTAPTETFSLFVLAAYILIMLQFLITVGYTYGFAYEHELKQIAFTETLSQKLSVIGIEIGPMKRTAGRPWWVVCVFLFIITLGLFSFVMFVLACRSLNHHISNQWDYETELLNKIIEHEGGRGIRAVDGSEPGMAKKIIRSLV